VFGKSGAMSEPNHSAHLSATMITFKRVPRMLIEIVEVHFLEMSSNENREMWVVKYLFTSKAYACKVK
jgi:hypothetical protein